MAAQFLRCRGRSSLVTAVRFSNGQEALSIVYSGAKYTRFPPKIAAIRNHFFGWSKTANSSTAYGTATLKSLLLQAFAVSNVHPRPRKRLARCTLDCGFKTSESPALRGFVGERCPIRGTSLYLVLKSNSLHRSKNLPVKFGFSSKTVPANIVQKLPAQRCSKSLFIVFFNFSHKRPTFAFTSESGYTLAFRRRIAHSGSHAETGAFPSAGTAWLCAANRIALNAAFATPDSTVLLYTYISRFSVNPHYQQTRKIRQSCRHKFYPQLFLVAFSTSPTNGPRSLSQAKEGIHTRLCSKDRTQGLTRRNTGLPDGGVVSLPSTRTARSRTSPGRVSKRRTLPLWDLGREVLSKDTESLRDSDVLMHVAVPRRRGPAGLRDPVSALLIMW